MRNEALKSLRVAINGGSIGGLCARIAFRGHEAAVDIYERIPDRWKRAALAWSSRPK